MGYINLLFVEEIKLEIQRWHQGRQLKKGSTHAAPEAAKQTEQEQILSREKIHTVVSGEDGVTSSGRGC